MKPFDLRVAAAAFAVALLIVGAARQPIVALDKARTPATSKPEVLDNIARNVLLPGYNELAARGRELAVSADALVSSPNLAALKRAQQAWRAVLLAWRRTQSFVHGPATDLGVAGRIVFWPSRRQTVDRVLRATRPIDDVYVQELGANAVGLTALEIMLFDIRRDDAARIGALAGPQGDRQRQYLQALAHDLEAKTRLLESAWQGPGGYAAKFAAGGQQQLNLLVNDMLAAIEAGAQNRLQVVIDRQAASQLPTDLVEGGLSGTSQQGVAALLAGASAAFKGGEGAGLDDYLAQLKSPAARRVDAQFQKTIAAVTVIDSPLEQAITTRAAAVRLARDECRALEILIKTEVASTLGVTLTFKSTDGD
jgi:predicted lipoprotein